MTQLFILLPEFEKNAEQLKPILWDCAKEIESLLSEFETIESWAFILCRLILFESRLLEINLVKRLSAVKIIYLEDGYVNSDPIVIVELFNYLFARLFCGGGEMHVNPFYSH